MGPFVHNTCTCHQVQTFLSGIFFQSWPFLTPFIVPPFCKTFKRTAVRFDLRMFFFPFDIYLPFPSGSFKALDVSIANPTNIFGVRSCTTFVPRYDLCETCCSSLTASENSPVSFPGLVDAARQMRSAWRMKSCLLLCLTAESPGFPRRTGSHPNFGLVRFKLRGL